MRVKKLAQEHNTMSPARARTRTAGSVDKHTNHEATAPPSNGLLVLSHVMLSAYICELMKISVSSLSYLSPIFLTFDM